MPKKPGPKQTASPWEIRPKAPTGSPTDDEIYRAVGMALTSWEYAETALAALFARFARAEADSKVIEPAAQAYGSITNFNSRVGMVQIAAQAFFQLAEDRGCPVDDIDDVSASFRELTRFTNGLAERRNNIAHGVVSHVSGRGHYLMPPMYNSKKYKLVTAPQWERCTFAFTAEDIRYYRANFEELYDEIFAFDELLDWRLRPSH